MEPTQVRVAVMDSQRPGEVVTLPVEHLSPGMRAWRGLRLLLLVSGAGVIIVFVPLMHLCGVAIALVAGPVAGVFGWRQSARLGGGEVNCPKCSQPVKLKEGLGGWPARAHCDACGASLELHRADAAA